MGTETHPLAPEVSLETWVCLGLRGSSVSWVGFLYPKYQCLVACVILKTDNLEEAVLEIPSFFYDHLGHHHAFPFASSSLWTSASVHKVWARGMRVMLGVLGCTHML